MGGVYRSGDKRYDVEERNGKVYVTTPTWVPFSSEHIATVDNEKEAMDAIKSDSGSRSIRKD
jgi:hypothetical protein